MAARTYLLVSRVFMRPSAPPHRAAIRSLASAVLAVVFLAACGGTPAKPTADDAATIAAASTASATAAGASAGAGASRTPGATTGVTGAGAARGFGGLLTPVRGTATSAGTRGAGTASRSTSGAGSTTGAGRATGTADVNASPQSPVLDPCTLLTPAEVTRVMGEPFSQFTNEDESPEGTSSRLRGYSSASCTFAAAASTQDAVRAVQVGTIRRTPATSPPTGSGAFRTITEVWTYIKQQAQGSTGNPSVLMGVGDEAFVLDDPDNPGDEDVFVRKGDIVLLVIVTGYDMSARDKAVAVATQAVTRL